MFTTLRDGIAGILKSLKYVESHETTDFKDSPETEYGNTFILTTDAGEKKQDFLIDRFWDGQTWLVQVAFKKSENSAAAEYQIMQVAKDALIKALDNIANWRSYAKNQSYASWAIEERKSLYVLKIKVKVTDEYTY